MGLIQPKLILIASDQIHELNVLAIVAPRASSTYKRVWISVEVPYVYDYTSIDVVVFDSKLNNFYFVFFIGLTFASASDCDSPWKPDRWRVRRESPRYSVSTSTDKSKPI